ncbi:glycosyltransferase family 2 protein [bacterium]|nr:glycosyltransferase family 2 protein [bacterium]
MKRPGVSVVIPVKNAESTLAHCLDCVTRESGFVHEIIIVDDGSNDRSEEIAHNYQLVRVVRTDETRRGVSRARNAGAREAQGDIVLFIDSDVLLKPGSIELLASIFQEQALNAVVGLLDPDSYYRNFASDYKNLWMHYTYKIQPRETSLFYTSIAAIRRSLFNELGGFDEAYRRPGLEDTAFGNKLFASGHSVRLIPELQAIHVKKYTLVDILKLDYQRAKALVKIQLRKGLAGLKTGNKSSVPLTFILSIVPGFLAGVLFFIALLWQDHVALFSSLLLVALTLFLNRDILSFLFKQRGCIFLIKTILFLLVDSTVLMFGIIMALIEYALGKRY